MSLAQRYGAGARTVQTPYGAAIVNSEGEIYVGGELIAEYGPSGDPHRTRKAMVGRILERRNQT